MYGNLATVVAQQRDRRIAVFAARQLVETLFQKRGILRIKCQPGLRRFLFREDIVQIGIAVELRLREKAKIAEIETHRAVVKTHPKRFVVAQMLFAEQCASAKQRPVAGVESVGRLNSKRVLPVRGSQLAVRCQMNTGQMLMMDFHARFRATPDFVEQRQRIFVHLFRSVANGDRLGGRIEGKRRRKMPA